MNSNLKFDFEVNKDNNTIVVKREFAANLELVWKAWTTAELLDEWCAAETDQRNWGKQNFGKIVLHKSFSGTDVFCDENGTVNPEFPAGNFENLFSETGGKTTVTMISKHNSFEDIQAVIEMGFKEGIEVSFNQLDKLFK